MGEPTSTSTDTGCVESTWRALWTTYGNVHNVISAVRRYEALDNALYYMGLVIREDSTVCRECYQHGRRSLDYTVELVAFTHWLHEYVPGFRDEVLAERTRLISLHRGPYRGLWRDATDIVNDRYWDLRP